MPISSSDLVFYPAASSPLTDGGTSGGNIDLTGRLIDGNILLASERLEFVSSSASDIGDIVIRGRSRGGEYIIERLVLSGTAVVKGKTFFYRILEIESTSVPVGNISVRKQSDSSVIQTVAIGISKYTTLFKNAWSKEGSSIIRYEKFFIKNVHVTDDLTTGIISIVTDASNTLSIGLDTSVNNNLSVVNRLTAPVGITFVAKNVNVNLPGDQKLDETEAIGVWLKQTLTSGLVISNNIPNIIISGVS